MVSDSRTRGHECGFSAQSRYTTSCLAQIQSTLQCDRSWGLKHSLTVARPFNLCFFHSPLLELSLLDVSKNHSRARSETYKCMDVQHAIFSLDWSQNWHCWELLATTFLPKFPTWSPDCLKFDLLAVKCPFQMHSHDRFNFQGAQSETYKVIDDQHAVAFPNWPSEFTTFGIAGNQIRHIFLNLIARTSWIGHSGHEIRFGSHHDLRYRFPGGLTWNI